MESVAILKLTTDLTPGQKSSQDRFLKDCSSLGYKPTEVEVSMLYPRLPFNFDNLDNKSHPDNLGEILEERGILSHDTRNKMKEIIKSWGPKDAVIGTAEKELATQLVGSLFENLEGAEAGSTSFERTKEIRNQIFSQKQTNINLGARGKFDDLLSFSEGVQIKGNLYRIVRACVTAYAQIGEHPFAKKGIASVLEEAYKQVGLERYSNQETISKALLMFSDAIEPIKAELLYYLNGKIGLPKRV